MQTPTAAKKSTRGKLSKSFDLFLNLLFNFLIRFLAKSRHPVATPPDYFLKRIILAACNSDVEDLNADVLGKMYSDCRTYYSADLIVTEAGADDDLEEEPFPPEFLCTLSASGLLPGELQLKVGCPLILLCNLAPGIGLCNGTHMVLLRTTPKVLEVCLIGGDHDGDIAMIPHTMSTPSGWNVDFSFKL